MIPFPRLSDFGTPEEAVALRGELRSSSGAAIHSASSAGALQREQPVVSADTILSDPEGITSISSIALDREAKLREVAATMRDMGLSQSAACRECKLDPATYGRWLAAFQLEGIAGLEPRTANCGRRPLATLNPEEIQTARRIYAQTGSATQALRHLAQLPECRDEVAEAILKRRRSKHTLTKTLRRQISSLPSAVIDFHKSPKRSTRENFICPRTLTYLDAHGIERRIEPGDLSERDDMSNNFLCWVEWPWGGDPCSDKYGVRLARGQNLIQIDVGSLFFQSFNFLIRLRDSYRADDIWQWVGQTYRDMGMPAIGERWERGVWQANKLQGTVIEAGHTSQEARLGGIAALNRRIIVSQSPTTKIIENRFSFLQTIMATIPGQIGRSRGEMEGVNKLWTECRQGRRDPRDYFLSYEAAAAAIEAKLHYCNAEPVEGRLYHGIPAEIWRSGGGPERLTKLSAEQTYLFSRDRSEVTVVKGHAMVRYTNPDGRRAAWWFHHEDLWRHEGEKVSVYFDKQSPESGATLAHASGTHLNRVIGSAALVDGTPQFALGLDSGGEGRGSQASVDAYDRKRDFSNAVRADYRSLGMPGTRIARGSHASDGAGRSTTVEIGGARQEAAAKKPSRESRPPTPEPDFDEIDRMEREAFRRGDLIHT